MSPDGSAPNLVEQPAANVSPTPTFADVIRDLAADPALDPGLRREMCSAIRKVCRVLNLDPGSVPANPSRLRMLITPITAAAAGVSPGRWANIRSLTLKALKRANIPSMPGRYREPLAPEWEALRARLPDRRFRSALSSLISYCSVHGIGPADITVETFAQFGAELETSSIKRDPGGVYRDSCKLWNKASENIPGWQKLQVPVPDRRRHFAFGLHAFPPSFQADVDRFLSQRANPDVFDDNYAKPVRPLTNSTRRQNILMAATALVKTGFPVDEITSLDILVDLGNAKALLSLLLNRASGRKTGYIHHIATLLKTIARHHAHKDEKTLMGLRDMCGKLNPGRRGLTEKNQRFLRQFADLQKLAALLALPRRLLSEPDHHGGDHRGEAVKVALGLAIGIELVIPLRADNLSGLRLDRHIHRAGKAVILSIPAEETKNDNPIDAELPPWLVRLMNRYLERYRPRLIGAPSPWLFPGENGERRSSGFGVQISELIAKEIGITMTPHQFRHFAAKLYLDRCPGDYETVRRLLGHRDIATTMRFYRELDRVLAVQRYGELVEQLLGELESGMVPKGSDRHRSHEDRDV